MENELRDKIERFKIKAEGFLKEDIRAFIVDIYDTWYSCDILFVGETSLLIRNFKGDNIGINKKLFWADVVKLEEHKKEEGEDDDL